MCRSKDIRTRVEAGSIRKKWRRSNKTPEDDNSLSVDLHRFSMCKQNSAVLLVRDPSLRNAKIRVFRWPPLSDFGLLISCLQKHRSTIR